MKKAKHAFGNSDSIEVAKQEKKIDSFDILFLDGDSDPKIGWIDKQGNTIIVPNKTDLSGVEAAISTKAEASDVEALEGQIATKVDAETVQSMIEEHSKSVIEVVEF